MRSIILSMDEMSDSKELYRAKPKTVVVYALYLICAIMIVFGVAACFFRVDSVVKGSGVLVDSEEVRYALNNESSKRGNKREVDMLCRGEDKQVESGSITRSRRREYGRGASKFHVEMYISSYDVGKIREGQEVKFELAAYPANKYGYCRGIICDISKDAVVSERVKVPYYLVMVKSDNIMDDARKKNITLRNGMPCKGNVVVGKKTLINYILEKI